MLTTFIESPSLCLLYVYIADSLTSPVDGTFKVIYSILYETEWSTKNEKYLYSINRATLGDPSERELIIPISITIWNYLTACMNL